MQASGRSLFLLSPSWEPGGTTPPQGKNSMKDKGVLETVMMKVDGSYNVSAILMLLTLLVDFFLNLAYRTNLISQLMPIIVAPIQTNPPIFLFIGDFFLVALVTKKYKTKF